MVSAFSPPVLYLTDDDDDDHEVERNISNGASFTPINNEKLPRKKRKLTNANVRINPSIVNWTKRYRNDYYHQYEQPIYNPNHYESEPINTTSDEYNFHNQQSHSFHAFDWSSEPQTPPRIYSDSNQTASRISIVPPSNIINVTKHHLDQSDTFPLTPVAHQNDRYPQLPPQKKSTSIPVTLAPPPPPPPRPLPLPLPTPTSSLIRPQTQRIPQRKNAPVPYRHSTPPPPPPPILPPPPPPSLPTYRQSRQVSPTVTYRSPSPASISTPVTTLEIRRQALNGTGILSAFYDSKCYRCNICKFKSTSSATLLQHLFNHIFFCQQCPFYSYSHHSLYEHIFEKHHTDVNKHSIDPKNLDLLYITRCSDGTFALCVDSSSPPPPLPPPPVQSSIPHPVQPLFSPPVQPPTRYSAQPPIRSPVQPSLPPSIQPPIRSPAQPPIRSSVQSPIRSPVQPPIRSPVQLPIPPSIPSSIQPPIPPPVQQPTALPPIINTTSGEKTVNSSTANTKPKTPKKKPVKQKKAEDKDIIILSERRDMNSQPSSSSSISKLPIRKEKQTHTYVLMKHRRCYGIRFPPCLHSLTLEYSICREHTIRHMCHTQVFLKSRNFQSKSDVSGLHDEVAKCLKTVVNHVVNIEDNKDLSGLVHALPNNILNLIFPDDNLKTITSLLKLTNKYEKSIEQNEQYRLEYSVRTSNQYIFKLSSTGINKNEQSVFASLQASSPNIDSVFTQTILNKLPISCDNTHRFLKGNINLSTRPTESRPRSSKKTNITQTKNPDSIHSPLTKSLIVDTNNNSVTSSKSKFSPISSVIILD